MGKAKNIKKPKDLTPLELLLFRRKIKLEKESELIKQLNERDEITVDDSVILLKSMNCNFSLHTNDPKVIAQFQRLELKIEIQGQPKNKKLSSYKEFLVWQQIDLLKRI